LGSVILGIVGAMRALTKASLIATASVLGIPLLVGAAFLAIGLVVQDLYGYLTGMDSAIGSLIKDFPLLGKAVDFLTGAFDRLFTIVDGVYNLIAGIFNMDTAQMTKGVEKLGESFKDAFKVSSDTLPSVGKFLFEPTDFALLPKLFGSNAPDASTARPPSGIVGAAVPGRVNARSTGDTFNDNRTVQVNGADIAQVKKVLSQDRAYAMEVVSSGVER
jgi:hypothetical protein